MLIFKLLTRKLINIMPTAVLMILVVNTAAHIGNLKKRYGAEVPEEVWIGFFIESMSYKREFILLLSGFKKRQGANTGWLKIRLEIIQQQHGWIMKHKRAE